MAGKVEIIPEDYKERYGFSDPTDTYVIKGIRGLSEEVIKEISRIRDEPAWMEQLRLKALRHFLDRKPPAWAPELAKIDFQSFYYYAKPTDKPADSWDQLPEYIKRTYDKLGITEAEKKFLAGVGAIYECLSASSRVFTINGPKPISEIEEGDIVFSWDEKTEKIIQAPVRSKSYKGRRQVFEVRTDHTSIVATANHPFLVLEHALQDNGLWVKRWKYLSELKVGDLLITAKRLPKIDENYVPLNYAASYTSIGNKGSLLTYLLNTSQIHYNTQDGSKGFGILNEYIGISKITAITQAGIDDVYDIEINGPHNFVAEGLIVHNSEAVYHSIQKELEKQGVIFTDTVTALKEYPDIMKRYFGTVVPYQDNYIAALQTAVWSAGSFVYVPEGVKVQMPLQAYFRINAKNMGQFERTLIIAEPYSEVSYIEGCTAPVYSEQSLHSAVVEIIAKKGSFVKYTTLQNWSKDVLNLVTKRAHAYEDATVSWIDFNGGSKITRKYPSVYLLGPRAKADIISVAYAGAGQVQDTGGKAVHLAKDTSSKIISRSVSKDGGHTAYRGLLHIAKGAKNAKSVVRCDALLIDERSTTATYPYMEIQEDDATVTHEASVGKVGEEQLFYLMSRGISEGDALSMIVNGFLEPFTKELPMAYAVEFNRLMALEMTNAVG